jgi:hypothetical protein
MTSTITTVAPEIPRDRWGRPLVVPPGGGKRTAYTRCTTFIDCLDDRWALEQWKQRMTAIGIADRPDLLLAVSAHRDDKKQLNGICDQAIEAAKATAAATTGTALHALSELVDRGQDLPVLPDAARADLDAYKTAMEPFEVIDIEQFVVHDGLKVGGTFDRLVRWNGVTMIADLKTGSSIDYSLGKLAMQLAVYSRGQRYDIDTGQRTPLDAHQGTGIVIHLPAGQARCDVRFVDLNAGWEGVQLAAQVREWRKRKGFTAPFTP